MELDGLKKTWQQATIKTKLNTDIMNIIQHKSYGPVSALKRVFRKQMLVMSLIPLLLLLTNIDNVQVVFTSILFWSYVVFCIGIVTFASYNYRIVSKMGKMDGIVRTNIEQQVHLLEKRAKWEITGMRGALFFFILLTELVPNWQHYRMLDKWHALSPLVRFGSYAALILLQYFINGRISRQKVGRHLTYLKELIKEME